MLKKILSPKTCGECRICCCFDKSDVWEVPLVDEALKDYICENIDGDYSFRKSENGLIFNMDFGADGLSYCPMLSEKGCKLGDKKPLDCRIWPFRIMKLENFLAITISPVCPSVSSLPLAKLCEFINSGFAKKLFDEAEKNPSMIKKYIDGYPILAVRSKK